MIEEVTLKDVLIKIAIFLTAPIWIVLFMFLMCVVGGFEFFTGSDEFSDLI